MRKTLIDGLCISVITLIISYAANRAMELWIFKLTFPETMALEDVHWEDFSMKLRANTKSQESNIVLLNIGNVSRRETAKEIAALNKCNPKVIGMDVFFNCSEGKRDSINCPQLLDTLGNRMLRDAIHESNNLVMVSRLIQTPRAASNNLGVFDSLELSDESFMQFASHGFGNVLVEGEQRASLDNVVISSIRKIIPKITVNDTRELAFAIEVARFYDSAKADHFLKRNNEEEWISYRGSINQYKYSLGDKEIIKSPYFKYIDKDSLAAGLYPGNYLENKIVLIGFLGEYLNDPTIENRFYTPLNTTFAGRSMPDMMGVEMHANILAMILDNDFINEINPFLNNSINIFIFLFNVLLFIRLYKKESVWYDSLCFIIPVGQVLLYSWLRLELLSTYNLRVELEGVIYTVALVSFGVNLYYGPLSLLVKRIKPKP